MTEQYTPTTEEVQDAASVEGATGIDREDFYRWLDQVRAEVWDEGREAQMAYAAQQAMVLIRWPNPVEPPAEPVNPHRKAVQS